MKIAIIGGGASGLCASITATNKYSGKDITIFEQSARIGQKILVTGNGRCNYSNDDLSCNYFNVPYFVQYALENVDIEKFFNEIGLVGVSEEGRRYPITNQASSVLDVLRIKIEKLGINIKTDCFVKTINKSGNRFILNTNQGDFSFDKIILACGGMAGISEKSESYKNPGYKLCNKFGHKIKEIRPALTGLEVESQSFLSELKALNGLRVKAKATLKVDGEIVAIEKGEILYRNYGLSGIAIFNLSRFTCPGRISLDLFDGYSENDLFDLLKSRKSIMANYYLDEYFVGLCPKMIAMSLYKRTKIQTQGRLVNTLTDDEIKNLVSIMKNYSFPVTKPRGFDQAQIMSGGIDIKDVDDKTMESRLVKGLYFTGEVLNVDGPCGGYNLSWAFASGIIAGRNI